MAHGASQARRRLRHARMPLRSAVFISAGDDAWTSEVLDISATGVLVARPQTWAGQIGDVFSLDLLIGDTLNIHVEARVARVDGDELGFAYERIPEDKEIPLWTLLGGYADKLEDWSG